MNIFLNYPALNKIIWEFLVKISYNHLEELFMKHLLRIWDSDIFRYLETLHDMMLLLKELANNSPDVEAFFLSGLIQNSWVDYLIYQLGIDTNDPNTTKQFWCTFLGDIITTFKCDKVKVGHAIEAIDKTAKTAFKHQQLTAFSVLFNVLDKYAKVKNPFSSTIYQILSDYICYYHNDEDIRQFLLANMGEIIQENMMIPLEVWVYPLVKKIKRFFDDTYIFNAFDFTFFFIVANHK